MKTLSELSISTSPGPSGLNKAHLKVLFENKNLGKKIADAFTILINEPTKIKLVPGFY